VGVDDHAALADRLAAGQHGNAVRQEELRGDQGALGEAPGHPLPKQRVVGPDDSRRGSVRHHRLLVERLQRALDPAAGPDEVLVQHPLLR